MNSFKDRKNISIANLKSIVGETTQAPCVAESVLENKPVDKLPEQEYAIKDKAGELYSVRFQRSEDLWDIKLLHDGRKIGEANCLRHGENLLLGNIEIFSTAAPPGVMAVGTSPQLTMPNYRGRGAGAALLQFIIEQARLSGLQQITGNLHPQNLQDKRDLPDWYRGRGFTVRMNQGGPGGTIFPDLTRVKGASPEFGITFIVLIMSISPISALATFLSVNTSSRVPWQRKNEDRKTDHISGYGCFSGYSGRPRFFRSSRQCCPRLGASRNQSLILQSVQTMPGHAGPRRGT